MNGQSSSGCRLALGKGYEVYIECSARWRIGPLDLMKKSELDEKSDCDGIEKDVEEIRERGL